MAKWTFSGQKGVPGHCWVAQVWKDGKACIEVEPTDDPAEATEVARQVTVALNCYPKLLAACERMWMANRLVETAHEVHKQEAARELYNAWLDLRDAMNEAHSMEKQ